MPRVLMIYGASGHTGRLISKRAVEDGLRPILAGRNDGTLRPLAQALGLDYRMAHVEDAQQLAAVLQGVDVLLNAAGPFTKTAAPVVEACLRSGTHYLDVGGELPAFQALYERDRAAQARGVLVMPGVGFLVMATDCLSVHVARQLPGAVSLAIAVSRPAFLARGSRRTLVNLIDERVQVRRGGQLVNVPVGALERRFNFGTGEKACTAISGAETLATFLTTGIGDIEVFAPATTSERALYRAGALIAPWLKTAASQRALWVLADHWSLPWGRGRERQAVVVTAVDADGRSVAWRLVTPDAYESTVAMALAAVRRVITGPPERGFRTPGQVCGTELVFSLPGMTLQALRAHPRDSAPPLLSRMPSEARRRSSR